VNFAISFVSGFSMGMSGGETALSGLLYIAQLLFVLATLLPGLAVSVRRLHDTGRSGWFLLLSLIPLVGAIILIVFFAQAGLSGSNPYGEDPKAS
ncbi:MAG: DUF805 domain-containing protein, partial [Gammaproteobacteria bacterium]